MLQSICHRNPYSYLFIIIVLNVIITFVVVIILSKCWPQFCVQNGKSSTHSRTKETQHYLRDIQQISLYIKIKKKKVQTKQLFAEHGKHQTSQKCPFLYVMSKDARGRKIAEVEKKTCNTMEKFTKIDGIVITTIKKYFRRHL